MQHAWPAIEASLRVTDAASFDVEQPHDAGAVERHVRAAVARGVERIVSVGGDGTHNLISAAILRLPPPARPALGVVPYGTGGDFRRGLALPTALADAARHALHGPAHPIDAGRVDFEDHDGLAMSRFFINVCSFGVSGHVDAAVNSSSKRLGGTVSFLAAALRAQAAYRGSHLRLVTDGVDRGVHHVSLVAVANGRWFGGGMQIAPAALLDDGLLDITVLPWRPFVRSLRAIPSLYNGRVASRNDVITLRARTLEAHPVGGDAALLDVDGEAPGRAPVRVEVLPAALRVVTPRPELLLP